MNLVVMVMLLKPLLPDVGTFPAKPYSLQGM